MGMKRSMGQGFHLGLVQCLRIPCIRLRDTPYTEALEVVQLSRKDGRKSRENAGGGMERARYQSDLVHERVEVRPSPEDFSESVEGGDTVEVDRVEEHSLCADTPSSADKGAVAESGEVLELVGEVPVG